MFTPVLGDATTVVGAGGIAGMFGAFCVLLRIMIVDSRSDRKQRNEEWAAEREAFKQDIADLQKENIKRRAAEARCNRRVSTLIMVIQQAKTLPIQIPPEIFDDSLL